MSESRLPFDARRVKAPRESAPEPLTVSRLTRLIKANLETRFGTVWVVGEVSNFHRARSGHSYFSLVDAGGQIRAALFRGAAQRLWRTR